MGQSSPMLVARGNSKRDPSLELGSSVGVSECGNMNGLSMETFLQGTSWDVCGSSLLAVGLRRDLRPYTQDPAELQTTLLCKE